MRLGPAATVGILLGLALVLPGCGGQGSATAGTEAPPPRGAQAGASTASRVCRAQLHGLLRSMDTLRGRLTVGLRYDVYLREVHAAQAAYRAVPADRLALGCLVGAATPAERALNRYIVAANAWGDCLASASCVSEAIEPRLQREWALASKRLASAQEGLRGAGRG